MKFIINFGKELNEGLKAIINVKEISANKTQKILDNYGDEAVARDWKNVENDIRLGMRQHEVSYGYTK
ncbi:hypothetical protein [Veillonella caviae]|uniref:hypothetical protein n=1 Tax=Veillonella caviae TaxID=248316 RepID=UPI0023564077|nr:hypothetical protein [Veillonella caviae]